MTVPTDWECERCASEKWTTEISDVIRTNPKHEARGGRLKIICKNCGYCEYA